MTARSYAWISGAAVVTCVAILLADYAVATWRAPRDEKIVASLKRAVQSDAAVAARLNLEQKRIAAARRARKSKDNAVAWILIATAAVFLTCVKRVVEQFRRAGNLARSRLSAGSARDSQSRIVGTHERLHAPQIPPPVDLTFVDEIVAHEGRGVESAIVLLQAIQTHYRYLPDEALRRLCELTAITPAQLTGTSTFYGQFRSTPVGKHMVRVCHGTACHVAGARQITDELRRYLQIPAGADTDPARMFTVGEVACLGCCSLAPVMVLDGQTSGRLTPSAASAGLAHVEETEPA